MGILWGGICEGTLRDRYLMGNIYGWTGELLRVFNMGNLKGGHSGTCEKPKIMECLNWELMCPQYFRRRISKKNHISDAIICQVGIKWQYMWYILCMCCHLTRERDWIVQICIPIFFTRIRHMERRSHCTEVAKNVLFTGINSKSSLFLCFWRVLFSECDHWQNGPVCSLSHLNMGRK